MKNRNIFFISLLCWAAAGCARQGVRPAEENEARQETQAGFRMPEVPDSLTVPADRADFLATHYWDLFDFADTSLIRKPEITEQAFADFVHILPHARKSGEAVALLFERAGANEPMFAHFTALSEKYLYDPNSPLRNETLYLSVLETLLGSSRLSEAERLRTEYRLERVRKNRPGSEATDFAYLRDDGSRGRMSDISTDYTLLFFHDPGCEDCRRTEQYLTASPAVSRLVREGRLTVLAICTEGAETPWREATYPAGWINGCDEKRELTRGEVYDLRATPCLYLLGRGRRVLCKDEPAERIAAWLEENAEDAVSREKSF